jgi:uncharacterized membrane protein YgdD (TMEM256/DUF423 family)
MFRNLFIWGILFSLLSILLGAFGAHALKSLINIERLAIFETGVRYQFMHGAGLILLALYANQYQKIEVVHKGILWASKFFIMGVFCFSGSLYLLALQAIINISWAPILGPITPIGGLFFMLGWMAWLRVVFINKVDK